jgi:hypothetical protein
MTIEQLSQGPTRHIVLTMPGYVDAALRRFKVTLTRPTHAPAYCPRIAFGKSPPSAIQDESLPLSNINDIKFIQEVIGVFLYYARAVDATMIVTLNKLASRQANPTAALLNDVHIFLQYAATHRDARVVFYPSSMTLMTHSDASYLSEPEARSRAGGFFFLPRKGTPDSSQAVNGRNYGWNK